MRQNSVEPYKCPHPVKHHVKFQIEDFKPYRVQCGVCSKDITHLVGQQDVWISEGREDEI